jgi:type II secretory pathway pseudopilin PulG
MKSCVKSGFTIIETMLVLSVTGLLSIGILVGSSSFISQQRYSDAVRTVESNIQDQYGSSHNVQNERSDATGCNPITGQVEDGAGGAAVTTPTGRGSSECVVLGKSIEISSSGTEITTASVIGRQTLPLPPTPPTDDIAALSGYALSRSSLDLQETTLPWSIKIVDGASETAKPGTILILRSPRTGYTLTFISSSPIAGNTIPSSMITLANQKKETYCLSPNGLTSGQRSAIVIEKGASGPSAVTKVSNGSGC